MQIEPRTFTLPNGEVLTVRSLCADDAEALDAFRYATYSETYFMARYPEDGANLPSRRQNVCNRHGGTVLQEVQPAPSLHHS